MAFQKFIIGPYKSGLVKDVEPFYIPEDAFSKLLNAYVWRGRVRKKPGAITTSNTGANELEKVNRSRLRINLGNTSGAGAFNNAGVAVPGVQWKIGQAFSVGSTYFTVHQANGAMFRTAGAGASTFDTATGMVSITGAPAATAVYYYPAEPVMGFFNPEQDDVNNEKTWAWDTQFAYEFNTANDGWERLNGEAMAGDALWDSTINNKSAFFWATNYQGLVSEDTFIYVSNNNPNEARFMRYYNTVTNQWNSFRPTIQFVTGSPGLTLHCEAALMIVSFNNTLILLNTYEETTPGNVEHFPFRIRWCRDRSIPIDNTGISYFPYNQASPGFGAVLDSPSRQAIVGAEFLRNRLIIYMERETYELAILAQDNVTPFEWRKINTELGAESTFSTIPFDKTVLGIGQTGVHACTGTNVDRIDAKIPDEVFNIHNDIEGAKRVHGIRDYFTEMAYWTFPNFIDNPTYPTRILAFDYKHPSWSLWQDSITAYGYFQNPASRGATLSDQALFRQVIAGNQEGYTYLIDLDQPTNTPSLQITDINIGGAPTIVLTVIDNNLDVASADPNDIDFIRIENVVGVTGLNDNIYKVDSTTTNTVTITAAGVGGGPYAGGGTIRRVNRINILTKEFNPFTQDGRNVLMNKVNFLVNNQGGTLPAITIDYYISTSLLGTVDEAITTSTLIGTSVLQLAPYTLAPFEVSQRQFWHSVYFWADGEFVQFNIYWTDEQMAEPNISLTDFQLHGMILHAQQESVFSG